MPLEEQHNLANSVEERIKTGSVSMRPRKYFLGRIIGLYLLLGLFFVAALFLMVFAAEVAREFGLKRLLSVGLAGFSGFVMSFPWHILIFVLLLAFVALLLAVRNLEGVYRVPRLIPVIGVLIILLICSFAIIRSPISPSLFYSEGEQGHSLRSFGLLPSYVRTHWILATVVDVSPAGIAVRQQNTGSITVFELSEQADVDSILVGDRVLVQFIQQPGDMRRELVSMRKVGPSEEFTRSAE